MPTIDRILLDLPVPITTPRLILRPPQAGDGKGLHAAMLDGYADLVKWVYKPPSPPTVEMIEKEVRIQSATWILREDIRFICIRKDTNKIIGRLAYPAPLCNWDIPLIGISYFICRSAQAKGFATEAVNALTRYAFQTIKARKVEIKVDTDNKASVRVPEKLGFQLEATQIGNWPRPDKQELAEIRTYCAFNTEQLPPFDVKW